MATSRHEIADGQTLWRGRCLGQHAENTRDIFRAHRSDGFAVEDHSSGLGFEQSSERPEQGALATPVGADHRRDDSRVDLHVQLLDDDAVAVTEGEIFRDESRRFEGGHAETFRLLRTSR